VILITAHLVDPGVAKSLATPADAVVLPSPASLFGKGQTEEGKASGTDAKPGFVLP